MKSFRLWQYLDGNTDIKQYLNEADYSKYCQVLNKSLPPRRLRLFFKTVVYLWERFPKI